MTGRTLSQYKILEKIGEGAMGVVYKAEDQRLRRTIALKFLSKPTLDADEDRERFFLEAQAAAALDHPNICAVYGIEEAEGETFIAMAYIEGLTLQQTLAERALNLDEALRIAMGTGGGLGHAHENKIVHRDIKTANIMVTPKGEPKITDFGLAYLADRSKLTKSGTTLGTPLYMSPEQAMGQPTDRRSDVLVAWRGALRNGDRALAFSRRPDERYQHVDDMVVDLRRLRKHQGPAASVPDFERPVPAATAVPVGAATRRTEQTRADNSQRPSPSDVVISKAKLRLLWGLVAVSLAAALALAFGRFG